MVIFKEAPPQVGLFWFSKDYTSIVRVEGERKLSKFDLLRPSLVEPVGFHAKYTMPRDTPRGRIYYENKMFVVYVGEDCSLADEELIKLLKPQFGLTSVAFNKFKIIKHYHWNTKT